MGGVLINESICDNAEIVLLTRWGLGSDPPSKATDKKPETELHVNVYPTEYLQMKTG